MALHQPESRESDETESLPRMYFLSEKITSEFGRLLLQQAGIQKTPDGARLNVLDDACGIGIVSAHLRRVLSPAARQNLELTCLDIHGPMVEYVRRKAAREGWTAVNTIQGDARDTKLPDGTFTHVFINIGPTMWKDDRASIR